MQKSDIEYFKAELRKSADGSWYNWIPILRDAEHDPVLRNMLAQVETYWILKRQSKDSP